MPEATPGPGHNLSTDDRKVLFFIHLGRIGKIDDQLAILREQRKALRQEAKADGFELGVEIDQGLRIRNAEDVDTVATAIGKRLWVARAHGLVIEEQLDMFGAASPDSIQRAFDAGMQAGLMALDAKPPMDPGAEFNSWLEGWHAGQAKVREHMQRRMEAANAADGNASEIVDEEDVRPRFKTQPGADADAFAPAA